MIKVGQYYVCNQDCNKYVVKITQVHSYYIRYVTRNPYQPHFNTVNYGEFIGDIKDLIDNKLWVLVSKTKLTLRR